MASHAPAIRPAEGLNFANAVAMFRARVEKTPELTALRYRTDDQWSGMSWQGWEDASREIASGLVARAGVRPGDRVALMAGTRLDWVLCDLAIATCGAVSIPIHPTVTGDEAAFIAADAGCAVIIAGHGGLLARAQAAGARFELAVVMRPGRDGEPPATTLAELRAAGAEALERTGPELTRAVEATRLSDPFTIVYTSGTTGRPKGVVLLHRNIVYEAWAIKNTIAVDHTDATLVILPLAHIFARHMVWAAVHSGATTAFGGGEERLPADLQEIAPTYVAGVPRMFEKAHARIMADIGRRNPLERRACRWALDVGRRVSARRQRGQSIPAGLALEMAAADRLLFAGIRDRFGGRLRFFVSGAAPLARELAEFFHAAGILVLEGYGLTETTGATNVNRPDRFRFGTVGPALPGCEVLIAGDGEVLVRGHNVMAGYHGLPHDTAEAIDPDGWLHTGDLGEVHEGFLSITGRKKDIIITAGGKNIAPQKIERMLEAQDGIAHAVVCGDRRPHLVALLTLDEPELLALSRAERLGCQSYADLVRHPRIRQLVQRRVDQVNAELPRHETIKKFGLPPQPFSVAGGELTPTDKVKRSQVAGKYADLVDSLYEAAGAADRGSRTERSGGGP
jgi:long-chain acyl-CoA synthetase